MESKLFTELTVTEQANLSGGTGFVVVKINKSFNKQTNANLTKQYGAGNSNGTIQYNEIK